MRSWARAVALVLAVHGLAFCAVGASAYASFPGRNGKIAFERVDLKSPLLPSRIWTMNADGSDQVQVTGTPGNAAGNPTGLDDVDPAWSPDGRKIAYASGDVSYEIFVMNADGTSPTRLTANTTVDRAPAWSPDGSKLAFMRAPDGRQYDTYDIYVMDAGGRNVKRLTTHPQFDGYPSWSPHGDEIAFTRVIGENAEILVMNADGSSPRVVTHEAAHEVLKPSWSPDGSKLVFMRWNGRDEADLYLTDVDGSSAPRAITRGSAHDDWPSWSPDGTKIAFWRVPWRPTPDQIANRIFAVNIDGSQATALTSGNFDSRPDWQWEDGPSDRTPPNTRITRAPERFSLARRARFSFLSSERRSTFGCSLDGGLFVACSSAKTYSQIAPGSHTFRVRATDPAANTDRTPAVHRWKVGVQLTQLGINPSRLYAAARGPSIARRTGAEVRYTLSGPARVRFTVERNVAGRRVDGRCERRTRSNDARRRCVRRVRVRGNFTHAGSTGTNSFRFSGRLNGRPLPPGSYRLTATPVGQGEAGSMRAAFRIKRP